MPPIPFVDPATLAGAKLLYTADDIRKLLPHRGAMALVDGIVKFDREAALIAGFKDARPDEFWVPGHFPGNPMLPGVVMVEAAGQIAIILYKLMCPEISDRLIVFGGVDGVRFRGSIRPGERLWLAARKVELNRRVAKCACQGFAGDKLVFEGTVIGLPV